MELLLMLAYFLFVAVIIEISTTLPVLTGLKRKIARYQAISMLTNTGFTTDEAKLILDHPIRRRISGFLILFGAFSLAVIISILSSYLSDDIRFKELGMILVITCIVLILLKSKSISTVLKKNMSAKMEDQYELDELPIREVLYMKGDDLLTEVPIHKDSSFVHVNCGELFERNEDIQLLFIKRGEEILRLHLDEEQLLEGDLLYVLGQEEEIRKKFRHELGEKNEEEEDTSGYH